MKKLFLGGVIGIFVLGFTGCGHGSCDAYKTSDYSKYKVEHNQKVQMVQELTEAQK